MADEPLGDPVVYNPIHSDPPDLRPRRRTKRDNIVVSVSFPEFAHVHVSVSPYSKKMDAKSVRSRGTIYDHDFTHQIFFYEKVGMQFDGSHPIETVNIPLIKVAPSGSTPQTPQLRHEWEIQIGDIDDNGSPLSDDIYHSTSLIHDSDVGWIRHRNFVSLNSPRGVEDVVPKTTTQILHRGDVAAAKTFDLIIAGGTLPNNGTYRFYWVKFRNPGLVDLFYQVDHP